MTRVMAGATIIAALAGWTSPVAGQVFGAGIGPTISLEDGGGVDFHVMATLRFNREQGNPVGFRADAMVQFADDEIYIGTINALYNFTTSSEARVRPYVIGGAGLYANGGTDFGINAGAGATFPLGVGDSPARAFAEARYHVIFAEGNSIQQVPLTAGIMFVVGD
jgi:hypothetical protein